MPSIVKLGVRSRVELARALTALQSQRPGHGGATVMLAWPRRRQGACEPMRESRAQRSVAVLNAVPCFQEILAP
jgi:hypothetical protein